MAAWVDPDRYGWVHAPASDADWQTLLARYRAGASSPLARVFDVAKAHRCRTVIEENRYVDADYRSEYSAFWSQRFPDRSAFSRRLHFFRKRIPEGKIDRLPDDPGYLGYSTLRPLETGRVGRTVLAPPRRFDRARMALATDTVSLFGRSLSVRGAPFAEQDGDYLRCAHAAAWMCHYHAHLRGLVGRRLTAELVELSPTAGSVMRALPSPGLTLNQLQAIFGATGQPALFYGLSSLPSVRGVAEAQPTYDKDGDENPAGLWDVRLFSVICRYLNSGFPVLIGTRDHAFVLVGWYRENGRIRFIRCDDQWGPYERVVSPFTDRLAPWWSLMVPLPPKVYLSAEMAENAAHVSFRAYGAPGNAPQPLKDLAAGVATGDISLRTFLRSNAEYKATTSEQARDDAAQHVVRLARMPHFVWVVEAHDRARRIAGLDPVLAECVFDSTASDREPRLDVVSLPGITAAIPPDGGKRDFAATANAPWQSQLTMTNQ